MIQITVLKQYKSIKTSELFTIQDFTVLTGKNGSGKSHLMELIALNDSKFRSISIDGNSVSKIKYIGFNGLNPQVSEIGGYEEIVRKRKELWKQLIGCISEYKRESKSGRCSSVNDYIQRYSSARNGVFKYWYEKAGCNLEDLTENFVIKNFHLTTDEVFSSQFASVFKLYQMLYEDNQFASFRNEKYGEQNDVLTEEEFIEANGPKPWNLINDMLCRAGLPYKTNDPTGIKREEDFVLRLQDVNTGTEIKVADLSTGEKVLMSLALAIYNTSENEVRPDILLLDEPDAALHPEFSRVLLEAVQESIVKKAGVKVVISTHSPSTVALAPEESLYMMDKTLSQPVKITKKRAIGILTQDLANLHITADNRRQVFVESKYDVGYYSRLFNLLNYDFGVQPVFLEPRTNNASNCTDVINIVNSLRDNGNDLVYGIIDYDNHNTDQECNLVLGINHRYAIDNYILDPIYVAFLLVNEKIVATSAMGLPDYKFVNLGSMKNNELQTMICYIQDQLGLNTSTDTTYQTVNGKEFKVNSDYFTIQGHELEDKIKDKWPQLKSIAKNQDNLLKNYVLDRIADAYPQFLSMDFVDLFKRIK